MSVSPLLCIGAYINGQDATDTFISEKMAYLGWTENEAPVLHDILAKIPVGSLIAIKSFTPQGGLTIKAVGIVSSSRLFQHPTYGPFRSVKWLSENRLEYGPTDDKMHSIRTGAIYYEINPVIVEAIVKLIK
jgi:hypothetical protein